MLTDTYVCTDVVMNVTQGIPLCSTIVKLRGVVINYRFKCQLVLRKGNLTARCYIDQILGPVVAPMFHHRQGLVFHHDSARPHIACIFFTGKNIDVMPSTNSIDQAHQLRRSHLQPANLRELTAALHDVGPGYNCTCCATGVGL